MLLEFVVWNVAINVGGNGIPSVVLLDDQVEEATVSLLFSAEALFIRSTLLRSCSLPSEVVALLELLGILLELLGVLLEILCCSSSDPSLIVGLLRSDLVLSVVALLEKREPVVLLERVLLLFSVFSSILSSFLKSLCLLVEGAVASIVVPNSVSGITSPLTSTRCLTLVFVIIESGVVEADEGRGVSVALSRADDSPLVSSLKFPLDALLARFPLQFGG